MAEDEFDSRDVEALASEIFDYIYFSEIEGLLYPNGKGDDDPEKTNNTGWAKITLGKIIGMKPKIPQDYEGELLIMREGCLLLFVPDFGGHIPIEGKGGLRKCLDACVKEVTDFNKDVKTGIIISEEDGKKPDYDEIRRADPRK